MRDADDSFLCPDCEGWDSVPNEVLDFGDGQRLKVEFDCLRCTCRWEQWFREDGPPRIIDPGSPPEDDGVSIAESIERMDELVREERKRGKPDETGPVGVDPSLGQPS